METTNPPWLLVSHGKQYSKQIFYSVFDKRFHTRRVPDLRDKWVLASTYGWLATMDRDTADCCLWNPASMEKIDLPFLFRPFTYKRCFLSKPPNEPGCHVLFISLDFSRRAFCQVGDEEFVLQSSQNGDISLCAVVSFQGKIYGLADPDYRIVTVHFVGKTLELRPIFTEDGGQPLHICRPSRPWMSYYDNYLIESPCGELLAVHKMFHNNYDFRVFRVDTNRKECIELENIDNQAIFLSFMGTSFCCSSTGGIKSNSIYYTIPKSRNLHIYDLDDRSTTFLLPCHSVKRAQTSTHWIEHRSFTKM
ncbi:hypothetical protein BUALT_Bualt19G0115200 [Buddleja alternifolia]|uniref:KIB1-4 beta-propeller domain-containing protein n=1 Tax=Buddleja alternifolia TaxID=168488 RepID=A0AAV6W396_9LAMI|nr:hypothetical protein BUALT_Bualt19G0115200 [Buddleja alternifolia]